MYMSAEMLATLLTGLGLLLSLVAAFGWMIHRMDSIAERLDARITSTRAELKADISAFRTELHEGIDEVRAGLAGTNRELGEMRVSLARLEGPLRPGLIRPT